MKIWVIEAEITGLQKDCAVISQQLFAAENVELAYRKAETHLQEWNKTYENKRTFKLRSLTELLVVDGHDITYFVSPDA